MPYDGRVYRILIASPSDVEEERDAAVRAIQEWNDLHSYSRKVVLLPLRWETHTAPEYGGRPQEFINRAIVDNCDLLVGVFWTRIGTPTGVAESGTLEEIDRVAKLGKPVMLYFSKAGADPDELDLEQVKRLKDFKKKTYPNALTESYKTTIDFHDKFARQIELKIRDLQKTDTVGQPPPLLLNFFAPTDQKLIGRERTSSVELPVVENLRSRLDDFEDDEATTIEEAVAANSKLKSAVRVRLAISNQGSSGIRSLFVRMHIRTMSGRFEIIDRKSHKNKYRLLSPVSGIYYPTFTLHDDDDDDDDEKYGEMIQTGDCAKFEFEWDALQPQRIRPVPRTLLIVPQGSCDVEFVAEVFADSFPQPVELSSVLKIEAREERVSLEELVPNLRELLDQKKKSVPFLGATTFHSM